MEEKKTIITDVTTGRTIFSDYTLEQLEGLIAMDKDINAELHPDTPDQREQDEKQEGRTLIETAQGVREVLAALDMFPKAKEYFTGDDGKVSPRITLGLVKLSDTVARPIDEVVKVFELAQGTPYLVPFSIMLEMCCENSRF